jgi:hypothetical protein
LEISIIKLVLDKAGGNLEIWISNEF